MVTMKKARAMFANRIRVTRFLRDKNGDEFTIVVKARYPLVDSSFRDWVRTTTILEGELSPKLAAIRASR